MSGSWFDYSEGKSKRQLIKNDQARLLLFLSLLVIGVHLPSLTSLCMFSSLMFGLNFYLRISIKYFIGRLLLIIPFGLGALLLLPFTVPGTEIAHLGSFTISDEGVAKSLIISFKLLNAHLVMTIVLSTTPTNNLLLAMKKLGAPALFIEIIQFTLRYLSVLMDEAQKMMSAQKSRGLKTKGFLPRKTYKRIGELIGVLLVRSFKRSERIHLAMVARGLNWKKENEDGSTQNQQPQFSVSKFDKRTKRSLYYRSDRA